MLSCFTSAASAGDRLRPANWEEGSELAWATREVSIRKEDKETERVPLPPFLLLLPAPFPQGTSGEGDNGNCGSDLELKGAWRQFPVLLATVVAAAVAPLPEAAAAEAGAAVAGTAVVSSIA